MTHLTYTVSTVTHDSDGRISVSLPIGTYTDKAKAMRAAKRAAPGAKDCTTYGPSSLAYVGRAVTAVVAW